MTQGIPNIDRFLAYCQVRAISAKSEIFCQNQMSEHLYFVLSGSFVELKNDALDKEFIIGFYSKKEFFGVHGLFQNTSSRRETKVMARVDSIIAEIKYDRFMQIAKIYPNIMTELNTQVVTRLEKMTSRIYTMAVFDTESKVSHCLAELCRLPEAVQLDEGVQIKISCLEIAKMVGCTRECVGRMVRALIKKGQISRKGHTFIIYDHCL